MLPLHKKGNKEVLNYYRPVSLLPICSNHFKKIILDTISQHLIENKLLNPNLSDYMSGDYCIRQVISITHEVFSSLMLIRYLRLEVFF